MPFEKPPATPQRKRLVVVPWGQEKQGKTAFALSFPDPIRFLDFNFGTEGLDRHWNGKSIEFSRYRLTPLSEEKDTVAAINRFENEYMESLAYCNQRGGTVVVDTGSELYDHVQVAKLYEVKQRIPANKQAAWEPLAWDYAASNALMNSIYLAPLQMDAVNVVIVHKCKEIWADNERGQKVATGRYQIDGWKGTSGAVQMTCQCIKTGDKKYVVRVNTCRLDPSLEGETLASASYEFLAANLGIVR